MYYNLEVKYTARVGFEQISKNAKSAISEHTKDFNTNTGVEIIDINVTTHNVIVLCRVAYDVSVKKASMLIRKLIYAALRTYCTGLNQKMSYLVKGIDFRCSTEQLNSSFLKGYING